MPDDTKQALEVTVKRTAKNSMRTYAKDIKRETLMEKAIFMLKKGKINIDEVSEYFPELLESDIKEIFLS
ncbi:MAG: hypothetical protein HFH24_07945 [Ruminococcus sp.]|nr:hypothetical protein [Ruminococcus sp.]